MRYKKRSDTGRAKTGKMARKLREYPEIALKIEQLDGPVDFSGVFGRSAPLHIEVGCGKGTFLLSQAQAFPEVNFLGIEKARKYYRFAVDRLGRWQVANVRMVRTDAAWFIRRHVAEESVDCYHFYFPDPWPKRRHHKRRFFCRENLEQIIRTLRIGGVVQVATDHFEYFEVIRGLFESAEQLRPTDFVPAAGAGPGEVVGTNYERKYVKDRRAIHTVAAVRV